METTRNETTVEPGKTNDDGGNRPVTDELLTWLKDELGGINTYLSQLKDIRLEARHKRMAYWDGQSTDGRKHAAENGDEDVMPFEGACDKRVRLADMLVNDDTMLLLLATMDGQAQVVPMEGSDIQRAGKMKLVLRHVIGRLGWRWVRELIKGANYYLGDSPALFKMDVKWKRTPQLMLKRLTAQELMDRYVQNLVPADADENEALILAQAAVQEFMLKLADRNYQEDDLVGTLMAMFPDLKPARAKRVIAELRREGTAEFPLVTWDEGIEIEAQRLWEDFFVPDNTTDYQRARVVMEAEWLSRAELEAKAVTDGWSEEFIKGVLEHEGERCLEHELQEEDVRGSGKDDANYAGTYQVVHAQFLSANEDGYPGRYEVTFHANVNVPATEKRLLETVHGKYSGHVFQREVLTKYLMDSRGIPELAGTDQDLIKLLLDSSGDNAQVGALPPMVTVGRRTQGRLYIEPLCELQAKRDGDFKWLSPPQFPATSLKMTTEIKSLINDYWGREQPDGSNNVRVQISRRFKTMWWLANMAEVYRQILQLCQQYMSDEEVARVTNDNGERWVRSVEEIRGMFDVAIAYDSRDLDTEDMERRARIIKDTLMAMDREGVIDSAPIVESFLWRLEPSLAGRSLRGIDRAMRNEVEDEMKNYLQILGGVEPPMVTDGSQNYKMRLQMYEQLKERNPVIWDNQPEDRQRILQARIEHLAAMTEQYGENVEIGKQGTRAALGGSPPTQE